MEVAYGAQSEVGREGRTYRTLNDLSPGMPGKIYG
jgi:hypothetical protein